MAGEVDPARADFTKAIELHALYAQAINNPVLPTSDLGTRMRHAGTSRRRCASIRPRRPSAASSARTGAEAPRGDRLLRRVPEPHPGARHAESRLIRRISDRLQAPGASSIITPIDSRDKVTGSSGE